MSLTAEDLSQLRQMMNEVVEAKLSPVQASVEVVKDIAKDSTFRIAKIEHQTDAQFTAVES